MPVNKAFNQKALSDIESVKSDSISKKSLDYSLNKNEIKEWDNEKSLENDSLE